MDLFLDYFIPRLSAAVPTERGLIEAISSGYRACHPLFEDAAGQAAHRTRNYIRKNLSKYPLDSVANDDDGKPILTQAGKEQTVLDYLERQVRDVFFHGGNNIKFEPGVARIAFNDLNFQQQGQDARGINTLNSILKIITSAHSNEYDSDLNGMSFDELAERFATERKSVSEDEENEVNNASYTMNSAYRIVEIHSFEEAKPYYKYTCPDSRWCLTHMQDMWDSYTGEGRNRVYFVLKDGFEEIEPEQGEGCPLDEYGKSMMCVIVTNSDHDDSKPQLCTSTCRWNHANGGSDNVATVKQISEIIGQSFYSVFPPFSRAELHSRGLYTFREKLEDYERTRDTDIFDWVGGFSEGKARVDLDDRRNFIDEEGNILSKQWFDYVGNFSEGKARVKLNGKWNFIDKEGNILSKQWFDNAYKFCRGRAAVKLDDKWNFIDEEGNILSSQWFDNAGTFRRGRAAVRLDDKWNFIDEDGNILSKQWFDWVEDFPEEGNTRVILDGKLMYIDENGNILEN